MPLFFRSGYLTIQGYDKKYKSYELGYPNDEVKYGFIESLVPDGVGERVSEGKRYRGANVTGVGVI